MANKRVGILGTGEVGQALGAGFLAIGYEVKLGGREANNEKAAAWAKKHVGEICSAFGWNTIDLGGIEASRWLEPMCMVWVAHGMRTNTWSHAFKLLKRN